MRSFLFSSKRDMLARKNLHHIRASDMQKIFLILIAEICFGLNQTLFPHFSLDDRLVENLYLPPNQEFDLIQQYLGKGNKES